MAKFITILEQEGVTHDRFQDFLESGVAADIFDTESSFSNRIAICEAIGVNPEKRGMLFFEISYPVDLEKLFEATGCYCPRDQENIALTEIPDERQPCMPATHYFKAKLFHFPRDVSSRNARRRILRAGWKPAGHEHLLALMAKYRMGAKPIDPVSLQKLIALAQPATIACTLAGMGGCNRAMWEYIGEDGEYGPREPLCYLGIKRI